MTVQNTPDTNPGYYKNRAHECIEFTQHLNFNLGNAFKYIWRHKEKKRARRLGKSDVVSQTPTRRRAEV